MIYIHLVRPTVFRLYLCVCQKLNRQSVISLTKNIWPTKWITNGILRFYLYQNWLANIILYELENPLILENKTKAQIEIIRQRARCGGKITVISLNHDLWDRFILQTYLKNPLI